MIMFLGRSVGAAANRAHNLKKSTKLSQRPCAGHSRLAKSKYFTGGCPGGVTRQGPGNQYCAKPREAPEGCAVAMATNMSRPSPRRRWLADSYDQSVFEQLCHSNSVRVGIASDASAANRGTSRWPKQANDHDVLAISGDSKSRISALAFDAIEDNRGALGTCLVAKAHEVGASSCDSQAVMVGRARAAVAGSKGSRYKFKQANDQAGIARVLDEYDEQVGSAA